MRNKLLIESGIQLVTLVVAGCACPACPEPPTEPSAVTSSAEECVDLSHVNGGDEVDPIFEIDGLMFTALGEDEPFARDLAVDVHGLHFASDGIQVDLPRAASVMTSMIGAWGRSLEITALDSSDNVVEQTTVPGDNSVQAINVTGPGIASVVITGGDSEDVLLELCIEAEPRGERG